MGDEFPHNGTIDKEERCASAQESCGHRMTKTNRKNIPVDRVKKQFFNF